MKFRKKPVIIDAIQWRNNFDEIKRFFPEYRKIHLGHNNSLKIYTLEGEMTASLGDWIIQGVANEVYPCKPDIFEKTYEPV